MSLLKNRLGIPGVISILALVLAMAGGAFAAQKYVITKTSQIKPSVLKQLKGAAGAPGAPGAAGAKGDAGSNGTNGSNGQSVTTSTASVAECPDGGVKLTAANGSSKVCNGAEGEEGEEGPEGSPWVAGEVPSGTVLKGTWVVPPATATAPSQVFYVPISTVVPIDPTELLVFKAPAPGPCPNGTADAPAGGAGPTVLCIFTKESTNLNAEPSNGFSKLKASGGGAVVAMTATAAGAVSGIGSWTLVAP